MNVYGLILEGQGRKLGVIKAPSVEEAKKKAEKKYEGYKIKSIQPLALIR